MHLPLRVLARRRRLARALATAADAAWTPPPPPDPAAFPPPRVRTFSLVAHVDHGKSTLADRMLEAAGVLAGGGVSRAQYLDRLPVERARGITVKAQAATFVWPPPTREAGRGGGGGGGGGVNLLTPPPPPTLINLVDTPGHVDFAYEADRALQACGGAALLVDAAQGVQARTVASFRAAARLGVAVLPVLTKIDAAAADAGAATDQLAALWASAAAADPAAASSSRLAPFDPASVLATSGRTGAGVADLLDAIVARLPPPPTPPPSAPMRALVVDANVDDFKGVVLLVAVVDGSVRPGDRVSFAARGGGPYGVAAVGMNTPEPAAVPFLGPGHVGWVVCGGLKDAASVRVGDTLFSTAPAAGAGAAAGAPPARAARPPPPLPGFRPAKPMVFASVFPVDASDYDALAAALGRLTLADASVAVAKTASSALGAGFRLGFLGALHGEVFLQRLADDERGVEVLSTPPTVPYRVLPRGVCAASTPRSALPPPLTSAADFPKALPRGTTVLEPVVTASILVPAARVGAAMDLAAAARGVLVDHASLGGATARLAYTLPLAELGAGFATRLLSATSGTASLDYEDEGGEAPADVVRLDLALNGAPVDALARVVPRSAAAAEGRALVAAAAAVVGAQLFEVAVQAVADGRPVARATVKARRRNVTAKCYGGDVSRKKKLLAKQKEGKKRMKRLGSVDVPVSAFRALVTSGGGGGVGGK